VSHQPIDLIHEDVELGLITASQIAAYTAERIPRDNTGLETTPVVRAHAVAMQFESSRMKLRDGGLLLYLYT
jgi:hypothetical protein